MVDEGASRREALQLGAASLMAAMALDSTRAFALTAGMEAGDLKGLAWANNAMRWVQVAFTEDDPPNYDPQFWFDFFRKTHADAVCLSAGGCICFYPSKLPLQKRAKYLGDHDMFGEMKAACLLQNASRRSATALTAATALEMATINGARAIGRGHELGSLEAGKLADIVLVDFRRAHNVPAHNVVSNLVFATYPGDVDTVIIGGRVVFAGGIMQGIDEAAIIARAEARGQTIAAQLGLPAAAAEES